jgi:hypothetical protein
MLTHHYSRRDYVFFCRTCDVELAEVDVCLSHACTEAHCAACCPYRPGRRRWQSVETGTVRGGVL